MKTGQASLEFMIIFATMLLFTLVLAGMMVEMGKSTSWLKIVNGDWETKMDDQITTDQMVLGLNGSYRRWVVADS